MLLADDTLSESARARVGRVLRGKWRLDRLLGVGGMAAVYSATHRNGNRVAIKILHAGRSADNETRASFVREGYLANAVRHVDVVRALDDDVTEDGAAFLVMELVEGETLDVRCVRKGGVLSLGEVFAVLDAVLDVLQAAHAAGIFHRDIKPGNIMVTYDGRVKLFDFGIAHDMPSSSTMAVAGRGDKAARTAVGTPAFMAPEQACGGTRFAIDGRADLWSLAATAFAMISGAVVHPNDDFVAQLKMARSQPARSLADAAPEAPPAVVALIDRALAFDKAARFPSARAMRDALHGAAAELDISLVLVDVPPPKPSSSRWLIEPDLHAAFPLFYDAPANHVSEQPLVREAEGGRHASRGSSLPPVGRGSLLALAAAVIILPVLGLVFGRYLAAMSADASPTTWSAPGAHGSTLRAPASVPEAAAREVASAPPASASASARESASRHAKPLGRLTARWFNTIRLPALEPQRSVSRPSA